MRLLLTVTRAGEVPVALDAGADLVDVKDPARGSLGWPGREVLGRVAARLRGRAPLGAPLGDGPHAPRELAARVEAAARADAAYLKLGLLRRAADADGAAATRADASGPERSARHGPDPAEVLRSARRALAGAGPGGTSAALMAVTFADAPPGAAPVPERAVETAAAAGADGVMLDTLGKAGGSIVERLGVSRLRRWVRAARAEGLRTALAGGLSAPDLRRLRGADPDVVGVRGAACEGGRAGRLDPARCRALRRAADGSRTADRRAAPRTA